MASAQMYAVILPQAQAKPEIAPARGGGSASGWGCGFKVSAQRFVAGCATVQERMERWSAARGRWRALRYRLLRQLPAGLLRHHVSGIPAVPIRIGSADALLVFAVRSLGAPHRVRQIVC